MFFKVLFIFSLYFKTIYSYLSNSEYRSFNISSLNTSSYQFYSNWLLSLKYFNGTTSNYYKICDKQPYFGYFREGNISMFYTDKQYGSLGFNFNLILLQKT